MRRLRLRLAIDCPDAAESAAALLPRGRLIRPRVVGGYHPQGGELDPGPLLARFAAAGAAIALPVAIERASPLAWRAACGPGSFTPDAFGIPAPPTSAASLMPDLIIVPVLAFDRRGGRLGQGAGCYDRSIARLRAAGALTVVGLAYAGQEVDATPVEAHDQALDAILTEKGYIAVTEDNRCG